MIARLWSFVRAHVGAVVAGLVAIFGAVAVAFSRKSGASVPDAMGPALAEDDARKADRTRSDALRAADETASRRRDVEAEAVSTRTVDQARATAISEMSADELTEEWERTK